MSMRNYSSAYSRYRLNKAIRETKIIKEVAPDLLDNHIEYCLERCSRRCWSFGKTRSAEALVVFVEKTWASAMVALAYHD